MALNESGVRRVRPLAATVDLRATRSNVAYLKGLLPEECRFMAVVKANGYGHGDLAVSRAALAAGADCLGVALLEEAVRLREAGFTCPVYLLFEPPPESAPQVLDSGVVCTVYSEPLARALSQTASRAGTRAPVHLKVDTGMRRVGVDYAEAAAFAGMLGELSGLDVQGIYTHFACADDPASPFTGLQMQRFEGAAAAAERILGRTLLKHAANSAAVMAFPGAHYDMVRVGIALHGLAPSRAFADAPLRPALSLGGKLAFVKKVAAGEGVSYGLRYTTQRDALIGTLPLGYADGMSRILTGNAEVLVRGRRRPVVGTICMDLCMVDLGSDPVEAGDPFVVIGRQGEEEITADEVAERLGTINYEVVCMISARVPRLYPDGDEGSTTT